MYDFSFQNITMLCFMYIKLPFVKYVALQVFYLWKNSAVINQLQINPRKVSNRYVSTQPLSKQSKMHNRNQVWE